MIDNNYVHTYVCDSLTILMWQMTLLMWQKVCTYVLPRVSIVSLILHKTKALPRLSVNNKSTIWVNEIYITYLYLSAHDSNKLSKHPIYVPGAYQLKLWHEIFLKFNSYFWQALFNHVNLLYFYKYLVSEYYSLFLYFL